MLHSISISAICCSRIISSCCMAFQSVNK